MTLHKLSYLLINNRTGWEALAPATAVSLGQAITLQPLPGTSRPLADPGGKFGGLALPAAMAIDSKGRLYVLDGVHIWRYDACAAGFERLKHIGGEGCAPRQFRAPQGLTISCQDDIFVADSGNRRVQIFSVKGLALRAVWGPYRVVVGPDRVSLEMVTAPCPDPCDESAEPTWPAGTWLPFDVVVDPQGRAYVSDSANGLIHVFDAHGRRRASWDGADENGVTLSQPTHLALDKAGNLYVVQAGIPEVTVLDRRGKFVRRVKQPAEVQGQFAPACIGLDAEGRLYVTDAYSGCVYVYDGEAQRSACRCHTFRGRNCAIAFDEEGRPLLADKVSGLVYTLENEPAYPAAGELIIGPLDSEIHRCVWHRVSLDGIIEPGTTVQVDSFTADAPRQAALVQALLESRWATGQVRGRPEDGEWDCLLLSPPGRYLWLRLKLRGDHRHTPTIRQIRADYPRRTSLDYLPAVFREDAVSAEFLARFLSIMDSVLGTVSDAVDDIWRLFDPYATPAEPDFLGWLASWLGLALEQNWPEHVRRRLLAEAHRLYALRGTPAGLRLHVALVTGVEPQLLEHYKLRRWLFLNSARLGDASVLWGADVVDRLQLGSHAQIGNFQLRDIGDPLRDPFHTHAHQFTLYVPMAGASECTMRILEQVVEQAKPAHTLGHLQLVTPRMCLGRRTIVGLNTVIAAYPSGVQVAGSRLGSGSVLSQSDDERDAPRLRVGVRSRIGSGTTIS